MSEKREGPAQSTSSRRTQSIKGHRKAATHRGDERHSPLAPLLAPPSQVSTHSSSSAASHRSRAAPDHQKPEPNSLRGAFISLMPRERRPWGRRGKGQASPTSRAVHAHAITAATAVWDPRELSAQRARQAATTRGFEQCHQWARQLSRPAAAKAVWPPLSSDRTAVRGARQRPRTAHDMRARVST